MREAVCTAYLNLTGQEAKFIFSGWDTDLTEEELAVIQEREPDVFVQIGVLQGQLTMMLERAKTLVNQAYKTVELSKQDNQVTSLPYGGEPCGDLDG